MVVRRGKVPLAPPYRFRRPNQPMDLDLVGLQSESRKWGATQCRSEFEGAVLRKPLCTLAFGLRCQPLFGGLWRAVGFLARPVTT